MLEVKPTSNCQLPRLLARLGVENAQKLAEEMQPNFGIIDLINLPNFTIYLRHMIDGVPSQSFSAVTIKEED